MREDHEGLEGLEVEVYDPPAAPANLFGGEDPADVLLRSVEVANALSGVIRAKQLFKRIGDKDHVLVEGWTLLGSMLGVFPVVVWTRKLEQGWEARVEARTLAGNVVGAAEAECLRSEKRWSTADDYAVRSMAQTRATSKALRGPLGFIVHLAGFSPTPDVEVPQEASESAESPVRTAAQNKKLHAVINKLDDTQPRQEGDWKDYARQWTMEHYGKASSADLTVDECGNLIDMLKALEVPFG